MKNPQISNFMKICPVGAKLLHVNGQADTDRQTDRRKLTVTFCNIMHVPEKGIYSNMVATVNNMLTTRQQQL
jgi:hypothetical protein